MLQIQRFPIPVQSGEVSITLPAGARILHLGLDPVKNEPRIYFVADTDIKLEQETRKFVWAMVGDTVPDEMWTDGYIGTVARGNSTAGAVLHLFEVL